MKRGAGLKNQFEKYADRMEFEQMKIKKEKLFIVVSQS
jgi:hypothetical protein